MDTSQKVYSEKEILELALAIKKEELSFQWLLGNCIELAAVADAIAKGSKTAENWLEKNGYKLLSEFINALVYEVNSSYDFLINCTQKEWAAVVDAVNDDNDEALDWLMKSQLKHFAALAQALREIEEQSGGGIGGIGGFGGGGGGFGGGGGGFGGFGGGGFGGAGAGGAW